MDSVRKVVRETKNIAGAEAFGQTPRSLYARDERYHAGHPPVPFVSPVALMVRLSVGACAETLASISVSPSSLAAGRRTRRAGPLRSPGFVGGDPEKPGRVNARGGLAVISKANEATCARR